MRQISFPYKLRQTSTHVLFYLPIDSHPASTITRKSQNRRLILPKSQNHCHQGIKPLGTKAGEDETKRGRRRVEKKKAPMPKSGRIC
eukprot:c21804_g1_i1 orf=644-904(+)